MFSGNWIRNIPLGKMLSNSKHHKQDCSISAIACNGTTILQDSDSGFAEEITWLLTSGREYADGYGAVYYHDSDYDKHHYQLLCQPANPDKVKVSNHILKTNANITNHSSFEGFTEDAKKKSGKVLMAYTKKQHGKIKPESNAPYHYTDDSSKVTYSMIHHGTLDKDMLLLRLPGFVDWLNANRKEMLNKELFSDSEYLFMWFIKNIYACQGDVLSALQKALTILNNNAIQGQINIVFSDGTGIYAYTNENNSHSENSINIAYKISRTIQNICSYKVRSGKSNPGLGWTTLKEHSLYFFPTQGAMLVYIDIDKVKEAELKFQPGYNWVTFSLMVC